MKRLINIVLGVSIAVLLGLGCRELYMFLNLEHENLEIQNLAIKVPSSEDSTDDWLDPNDPFNRYIDFDKLKSINKDIVGWLYVPGTKIDYPILTGSGDQTYLYKDYKGNYSYPGSIFTFSDVSLDNDDHVVFFGHNMVSRQMFGGLREYKSSKYAAKHTKAYVYTPDRTKECDLIGSFVCYKTDDVFGLTENEDLSSVDDWIKYINKRSMYKLDVPENAGQVFSLSTCSGYRGTSNRLVVSFSVTKEKYVLD